jgi:hypothetical protein
MSQIVKPIISFNKLVNMVLNDIVEFREFKQNATNREIKFVELMALSQYVDQYEIESLNN